MRTVIRSFRISTFAMHRRCRSCSATTRTRKPLARTAIIAGKTAAARRRSGGCGRRRSNCAGALPGSTVLRESTGGSRRTVGHAVRSPGAAHRYRRRRQAPLRLVAAAARSRQAGRALSDWMMLPWGSPEQLVLPTFHTAAEFGLKKGPATGDEMFLSVCGLMAAGSRTMLLSRWRVGGRSTADFVREYAQELPHLRPPEAHRRSITLLRGTSLDPREEGRLRAPPRSTSSSPTIRFSGPGTC